MEKSLNIIIRYSLSFLMIFIFKDQILEMINSKNPALLKNSLIAFILSSSFYLFQNLVTNKVEKKKNKGVSLKIKFNILINKFSYLSFYSSLCISLVAIIFNNYQKIEKELFISILLFFTVFYFVRKIISHFKQIKFEEEYTFINLFGTIKQENREKVIIHELGHLTTLALIKEQISDPYIEVMASQTLIEKWFFPKKYSGKVSFIKKDNSNQGHNTKYIEAIMKINLAGYISEKYFIGTCGFGSGMDFNNWMELSEKYLSLGLDYPFFSEPENKEQKEINHMSLCKLKDKQQKEVEELIKRNENLILIYRELLLKKDSLSEEEIMIFLNKVKL